MMAIIVIDFETADLTVADAKTETVLLRTLNYYLRTADLTARHRGNRATYGQAMQGLYLGSLINAMTSCQRPNDGSGSHEHAAHDSSRSYTIWRPVCSPLRYAC